jgi:hypothetical protein
MERGRYRWDPLTNYSLRPGFTNGRVTVTRLGTRATGPSLPEGDVVAVMGESATFCSLVKDRETWPYYLERELRRRGHGVNVLNFGVTAQHANHHEARFERDVAPLNPRVVVFFLDVNDAKMFMVMDLQGRERDFATLMSVTGKMRKRRPSQNLAVRGYRMARDRVEKKLKRMGWLSSYGYMFSEDAVDWEPDEEVMGHYRKMVWRLWGLAVGCGAAPVFIIPPRILRDKSAVMRLSQSKERVFAGFDNSKIPCYLGCLPEWRKRQTEVLELGPWPVADLRNVFAGEGVRDVTLDGIHYTPHGNWVFAMRLAGTLADVLREVSDGKKRDLHDCYGEERLGSEGGGEVGGRGLEWKSRPDGPPPP